MPDAISFKAIYDEYKNLVFNLSLQYVQHALDAEDITQEVFVKVYQNLHTEHIILVDKNKRIRGIYNGTLKLETEQLIKDIRQLKSE